MEDKRFIRVVISGEIKEVNNYNEDETDGLYVGDVVLSKLLKPITNEIVTARFYISDTEKTVEELKENLILTACGSIDADYYDYYSEYTGYLWTTDLLKIGNHNIIDDLASHEGKYLYLELDIHKQ